MRQVVQTLKKGYKLQTVTDGGDCVTLRMRILPVEPIVITDEKPTWRDISAKLRRLLGKPKL